MTKTRVVIQSRLNSTRLPGKAMLTVAGMPLIELVARRTARSGHEVVVATSEEPYDRWIADHLRKVGLRAFQGPLDDVLGRFALACADLEDSDLVVRLTGDNPVADADLVDELAAALALSDYSYGRVDIEQVPEGIGCEVFRVGDLRLAAATATDSYDREHVTPWIRRNLGELLWAPTDGPRDIHAYRATVDCLADYHRIMQLFDGVADPIAIGYRELFSKLAALLSAQGRMCRRYRLAGWDLSEVILDADALTKAPASQVREIFARAIDRGVSQIHLTQGVSEAVVHLGSDPQLRNRFQVIVQLSGVKPLDWELASSRADLGMKHVFAGYLAQLPTAEQWAELQAAQAAGKLSKLGVRVNNSQELAAAQQLSGIDFVVTAGFQAQPSDSFAVISTDASSSGPAIGDLTALDAAGNS